MEGRGPADLPPPALFMSTARALIVNLHQEKKIPIRRLIRDCKEMRDNSGYALGDVSSSKKKADNAPTFLGTSSKYNSGTCR